MVAVLKVEGEYPPGHPQNKTLAITKILPSPGQVLIIPVPIHNSGVNVYLISASVEGASHTDSRLPGLAKAYCVYMRECMPSMAYATDFLLAIVLSSQL